MLQQDSPSDYVIGTGISHSVGDLVEIAFDCVDLNPDEYVRTDPALARPAEVDDLVADYSKAERQLGWRPGTSFAELVQLMVETDLRLLRGGKPVESA
jgi:GDPmannose 4,6-dehydratase